MALVLGGEDGRKILEGTHPALKELFDTYSGTACRGVFRSSSTCVCHQVTDTRLLPQGRHTRLG